jgi:hypothetical protein
VRLVPVFSLLASALAVTSCMRQQIPGVVVDPAFKTLIAPDTKLLAGVDIDALKKTSFYQRHEKDLKAPILNSAAERFGVNPLRDVSELLAAWNGSDWLFMERGRWNSQDLQKRLIAGGARATTYRDRTVLGDNAGSLVFFKTVALEGPTPAVRRAIEIEAAGNGEVPEELAERLRTLPKHDQIWTVSRAGLAFADLPMNSDTQTALSNITGSVRGTTAGVYVDDGVHLSIDLQCVSDQGATRVHDALRGMIGFGRLSTKDNEEDLLRAYDAIQVEKKDQTVNVRADLQGNLADRLIATIPALRKPH